MLCVLTVPAGGPVFGFDEMTTSEGARHQPSKIVAISILLSAIAEGLMSMNTLGAYTVFKLFPRSIGPYDLRAVLLVHFGTDYAFSFGVLSGIYLLFIRNRRKR